MANLNFDPNATHELSAKGTSYTDKGHNSGENSPEQQTPVSVPRSALALRGELKTQLQLQHAAISRLKAELALKETEAKRIKDALVAMGESCPEGLRQSRCEALRDYMLDHPGEKVTTKLLASAPEKYGIITSAPKLQLNWLYGQNNPTARKFFEVTDGLIRLRPGITRETKAS